MIVNFVFMPFDGSMNRNIPFADHLRFFFDFRYVGAIQDPTTGSVIDRYAVPQRGVVPVRTVVPEVQEYQVYGQTMVPEVILRFTFQMCLTS
jgi:hypothetical protein